MEKLPLWEKYRMGGNGQIGVYSVKKRPCRHVALKLNGDTGIKSYIIILLRHLVGGHLNERKSKCLNILETSFVL